MNTINQQNYQSLILRTNKIYTKAQKEWFSLHNIGYGDKVRILKEFYKGCYGFVGDWNPLMKNTIGKIGTIIDPCEKRLDEDMVLVEFDTGECWAYPFFVLDPIKQPKFEDGQLILCRNTTMELWCIYSFHSYNEKSPYPYQVYDRLGTSAYVYGIPYEENKHLINVRNDYTVTSKDIINRKTMFSLKNETFIEYMHAQNNFIQNNSITSQTKFKIIDKFSDGKYGWCGDWKRGMNKLINSIVTYVECNQHGILIRDLNDHEFYVPFFVLEKVEKPKYTFKDKEVVLVRDSDDECWRIKAFKEYTGYDYPYGCYNSSRVKVAGWKQCIPYEGHEHLIGTKCPADC